MDALLSVIEPISHYEKVLYNSFRIHVTVALLFASIFVCQLRRYSLGCGQPPLDIAHVLRVVVMPI